MYSYRKKIMTKNLISMINIMSISNSIKIILARRYVNFKINNLINLRKIYA